MRCSRHELTRFTGTALLILLHVPLCAAASDMPRWDRESQLGQPLFKISTHQRIVDDPGKTGLDVLVEVMNDMLLFVRSKDGFVARINLDLTIVNTDNHQVVRQVKNVTKRVGEYAQTNSRRDYVVTAFSNDLSPGSYEVKVQLEDRESRRRENVEKKIELKITPFADHFNVSDIILARSSERDSGSRVPLHPTVSGMVVDPSSSLYCCFDVFRDNTLKPCRISLAVMNKSGVISFSDSMLIMEGNRLSTYFMSIPCSNLTFNRYDVLLNAVYDGKTISRSASFSVNFHGLPWIIVDLNQAIRQMRYVATDEEIKYLLNEFPSRKEELFTRFWNEKFPAGKEKVNGKMIEYYNRVNYANMHYSNNRAGWETDRGRILIIYGRPTEVEKRESETSSTRYEIWYYNHLNKRFIFKDEFGFGEYKLVSTGW